MKLRHGLVVALVLIGAAGPFFGCGREENAAPPASDAGTETSSDVGADASAVDAPSANDAEPDTASSLPECQAQRVVHVHTGRAGLGWFTLVWPYPSLISAFQASYAYDDTARAAPVTTSVDHPLYARKVNGKPVWEGTGSNPMPTALLIGQAVYPSRLDQTATSRGPYPQPQQGFRENVIAAGAAAQGLLGTRLRIVAVNGAFLGSSPGAPAAASVADPEQVPYLYASADGGIPQTEIDALGIEPGKLSTWFGPNAHPDVVTLAKQLFVTAKVLRKGYTGTFQLHAFLEEDATNAFVDVAAVTKRADDLASVLHAFYADLALANEAVCGHDGKVVKLADNVVFVVDGDSPRLPFERAPWRPTWPKLPNVLFVRANGWLKPGWFGAMAWDGMSVVTRTYFDPTTGALTTSDDAQLDTNLNSALDAVLFAIARGRTSSTAPWTAAPATFAGITSP